MQKPTNGTKLDMAYDDQQSKATAELRVADSATLARISVGGQAVAGGGKWLSSI